MPPSAKPKLNSGSKPGAKSAGGANFALKGPVVKFGCLEETALSTGRGVVSSIAPEPNKPTPAAPRPVYTFGFLIAELKNPPNPASVPAPALILEKVSEPILVNSPSVMLSLAANLAASSAPPFAKALPVLPNP